LFNKLVIDETKKAKLRPIEYDYGFFRGDEFIRPNRRYNKVMEFCDFYDLNYSANEPLPSVIAHSFGTLIIYEAMLKYDRIKFDTIIFCGSILHTKTDFRNLLDRDQFKKLINEHGSEEWFLKFTRLLTIKRKMGKAGNDGFLDIPVNRKDKIINKPNYKSHSEYLKPLHMKEHWIPELAKCIYQAEYDPQILRDEVIKRTYYSGYQNRTDFNVTSVGFYARIDNYGNYYTKVHNRGINNSDKIIDKVSFITAADGNSDASDMEFKVYDEENLSLPTEVRNNSTHYKEFQVNFLHAVNPSDTFEHKIYFMWEKPINLNRGDTDHWNIKNIENVKVQLNFPSPLKSPRIYELNEQTIINRLTLSHNQEIDNSYTYTLEYKNNKNIDGLIFYFEGVNKTTKLKNSLNKFKPKQIASIEGSKITIDRAKANDLEKIALLERTIEGPKAASLDTIKKRFETFPQGFLVIRDRQNKKIIGYLQSTIWNEKEFESFSEISNFPMHYNIRAKTLYVIFVGIDPEYRRRKFATKLIEEIEILAKSINIDKITLVAKAEIKNLYLGNGYKEGQELPEFLPGSTYKSVKMNKEF